MFDFRDLEFTQIRIKMKINIVIVALLMVGALCMRAADRVPGPPVHII